MGSLIASRLRRCRLTRLLQARFIQYSNLSKLIWSATLLGGRQALNPSRCHFGPLPRQVHIAAQFGTLRAPVLILLVFHSQVRLLRSSSLSPAILLERG